jgi:WD40 repeat protein
LDSAGDLIVTGRMFETGREDELVTIKFANSDGQLVWESKEGGAARMDDRALDIAVDASNNPAIVGLIQNADNSANLMVVKYDGSNGGAVWAVSEPGLVNDLTGDGWVEVDSNGDVIAGWKTWGGATSYDIRLTKYAGATGLVMWSQTYNHSGASADDPGDMMLDDSDNVIVVGSTAGNYLTVKFAGTDGSTLWSATYEGPQGWYDVANAVTIAPDGDILVAGFSDGTGTYWDVATLAYDPITGKQRWVERWDGMDNSTDEARALIVNDADCLFVTGYTYGSTSGMDQLVLAYQLPTTTDIGDAPVFRSVLLAHPNPFNPRVQLSFALSEDTLAKLTVRDLRGRVVATLHDGSLAAGERSFVWEGRDDLGREMSAGVYLAELRTPTGASTRKIMLVR